MIRKNNALLKSLLPIILIFLFVSSFAVVFNNTMKKLNIDQSMLIIGNLTLFVVTIISFSFYKKALYAGNTHVFLRNVYGSMLLKFFVCLIAIFIYIFSVGSAVNKPGLFTLLFLYLVYTFMEIGILMNQSKQIKQNKHA